ncbi:MAG: hypothetical protein ABSE77_18455 [Acidimicrobiales bacterium]
MAVAVGAGAGSWLALTVVGGVPVVGGVLADGLVLADGGVLVLTGVVGVVVVGIVGDRWC